MAFLQGDRNETFYQVSPGTYPGITAAPGYFSGETRKGSDAGMIELDNMKSEVLSYKNPIAEVRDSL